MTLEFGAHVSAAGGVDLALGRAAEYAMTSCQIFTKNERQWNAKPLDPAVIERFIAKMTETGMGKVVSHDSYLINLASPDDAMWEKSRLALMEEIRRCDLLGVPYLNSHPGAHVGSGVETGLARISEAINRTFDEMPDSKTMLLLETTAGMGTSLGSRFEEIASVIDGVEAKERIGVCIDTCHIFAAGYDLRDPESYAATMAEFDSIIGLSQLKALHINDSLKGLGSKVDRHAHIGEGELGRSSFELLVNDPRLAGLPGILETPVGADGKENGMNLETLRGMVRPAASV